MSSKERNEFREKRKYPRVDKIFEVNYELLNSPDRHFVSSQSKDISLGGISFQINQDIPIGSYMLVKFSLKELKGELKAIGRVVRIWLDVNNEQKERKYCAVKFTAMEPTDYQILNSLIQSYLENKS
ncbi:MAG: PilZ domain-containing protein [Leptospiraceae bacterium]|nr:PilZ domain-containing protein [Leptospiraceae bacterium]MDW7976510.1 PilZ domain-containing protein [Leptospiraceae bacterium]